MPIYTHPARRPVVACASLAVALFLAGCGTRPQPARQGDDCMLTYRAVPGGEVECLSRLPFKRHPAGVYQPGNRAE